MKVSHAYLRHWAARHRHERHVWSLGQDNSTMVHRVPMAMLPKNANRSFGGARGQAALAFGATGSRQGTVTLNLLGGLEEPRALHRVTCCCRISRFTARFELIRTIVSRVSLKSTRRTRIGPRTGHGTMLRHDKGLPSGADSRSVIRSSAACPHQNGGNARAGDMIAASIMYT